MITFHMARQILGYALFLAIWIGFSVLAYIHYKTALAPVCVFIGMIIYILLIWIAYGED